MIVKSRADRDLMYESIEEVAESHDEVRAQFDWGEENFDLSLIKKVDLPDC